MDASRYDDLANLRAELAAQRDEITRLKRRQHLPRHPLTRRALPILLTILLVALVPLATLAANPFNDLTGGVHDANIDAIYNAGITTGCDPNVSYCPTGLVTREEMASFLARTAGLGTNPPVANAATAVNATNAGNANTVGGFAPNALVRAARGTGPGVLLTTTYETAGTITITAPGPGVVLVNSTIVVGSGPPGAKAAQFRLRDTTSGQVSPIAEFGQTVANGEVFEATIPNTHAFAVSAGGPRTFVLEGRMLFGGMNAVLPSIVALYVPFGSTGGAGTLELGPEPAPVPEDGRLVTAR